MASFFPDRDGDLKSFLDNMCTRLATSGSTYGVGPELVISLETLTAAYSSALATAVDPLTRTRGAVAAKRSAKVEAISELRHVVSIIRTKRDITDQQLVEIGLLPRDKQRTPVATPTVSPMVEVVSMVGRLVRVRLRWPGPGTSARSNGVAGVTVCTQIGAEPPADPLQWSFLTTTSRSLVTLTFPASPTAERAWVTTFYFNPRKAAGPSAPPLAIDLPPATAAPMPGKMRLAA